MKKLKFPTAQTILLIIAALVAILTWIIPAGKYNSLAYNQDTKTFSVINQESTTTLPANQKTLDDLEIKIPLEKFTSGDFWKPISIPYTFHELEAGGLIGIMNSTGAFEAGIAWLAEALKGREYWLIIVTTFLISVGGTTFGLAEETIAFYPILIPIFLAAKYDAMVPLACIFLGSSVGSMCSTTNPFSVIIGSDAAGINWTTGLYFRLAMYALCTAICIIYILRYAKRVKADPTRSVIYEESEKVEQIFGSITHSTLKLTTRMRLMLFVFIMTFVVMVYGVSQLEWWFIEMTATFFVGAIIIGILAKMKE
ncbi:MAG: YfcC family protein, partial [Flavobacteriaceae bacterium]